MALDPKTEKGIQRFINYIRRMNQLNDEQMDILLGIKINEDPTYYTSIGITIEGHRQFIRQMALRTDDQLRDYLVKQIAINNDLVYQDIFTNAEKQKAIRDMEISAKDLKADPRGFARKVDAEFRK